MRLIRTIPFGAGICATTIAFCGTVVSADGGGDSDADASVDDATLQVSAEIVGGVVYTSGGESAGGGGSGGGESARGGGSGGGESAGGGGGGSAWTWSPADLGGGTIYEDGGYGEYSIVFGDRRINRDGTVEYLYFGDSGLLPGSVNDMAWVGPQPPAVFAPLPRPPTAAEILPGLRQRMEAALEAPTVEFVGLDPEFGWAYVVVPVGFRVTNTAPIAVTASVSAGPFTAWATITATPTEIRFDPGEPGGRAVVCPPSAAASTAFDSARPDACSYRYDNSSAVAGNGRTFETTTSMVYAITYQSSEGAGSFPAVTMSSTAELAVAEIQALVTCTGPRPEQGGC